MAMVGEPYDKGQRRRWVAGLAMLISWLLVGCAATAAEVPAVPTVASLFQLEANEAAAPTATPMPTAPLIVPTATPQSREVYLYQDEVAPGWSLAHSSNLAYDPLDTAHWFEIMDPQSKLDAGAVAIKVTPSRSGWGTLLFSLEPGSATSYRRDDVQGISFWLNSGNNYLSNDALVATIIGSNSTPYWVADDTSALTEFGYFPEIPLYDLAVNDTIPPHTWVKVILSMDRLLFGPEYDYVTGVYLKTKSFQSSPFYIDNVALLLTPQ
jgi:hypothetical protein